VSKYTIAEREQVKTIVSLLTIKRIPDSDILEEIERQTGKSIKKKSLWYIRQQIKKESYEWYKELRQGEFEYLHQFRERVSEIMDLQRKAHQIYDNTTNPSIQLDAISELHKLSISLSNLYDIAPYIVPKMGADLVNNDNSLSTTQQIKEQDIIV